MLSNVVAELESTSRRQSQASDPSVSAWVSANAGTGKTHVLTMRTLRLLLAGTAPERILCLTYTKAAAAEMSTRVFDRLSEWVTATGSDLDASLKKLLGRTPTDEERARARTLFTRAIETPGGLKVQTIHAFCERLLQRFPLEAGVPPGFSTLDDDLGRLLKREAIDGTLREAVKHNDRRIGQALKTAIAYAAEDRFDKVLSEAIAARDWLLAAIDRTSRMDAGDAEAAFAAADLDLRTAIGVRRKGRVSDIEKDMAEVLSSGTLGRIVEVWSQGKSTDVKIAEALAQAKGAKDIRGTLGGFQRAFLTSTGGPRARIATKAIQDTEPGLCDQLTDARDKFAKLDTERKGLACVEATVALMVLASDVLQRYSDAKARRAALDFDDLIEKTARLLGEGSGGAADWVLYKLDGGIDHILVDESQDTSPAQWNVVETLAREFYSGEGAREDVRTLFAVGDEKQSIYSFQGAAPEMFAQKGKQFSDMSKTAGQTWHSVELDLSFRTVEPILNAVDRVFANPGRTPGLGSIGAEIRHAAARVGHGGLVEIWPTETPEDADTTDAWIPLGEKAAVAPADKLASRIARTIKSWLESGERLVSQDRPITPGDILILVSKRRPFAAPMVAALKALGIPVAGADRMELNDQLAVQDLVALGDFVTLPDNDLALANVLKSPMFGLDDDDLFDLAYKRSGSLWRSLIEAQGRDARYLEAASLLKGWRQRADFQPPFEFFAQVLDRDGMRRRLLARLGTEAADPLDEFLNLAISYDDDAAPSLTGFLTWLRSGQRQVKRDMEQGSNEVRVMTVHASKGLEAPIVFLADTCRGAASGPDKEPLITISPSQKAPPLRAWRIKGASQIEAVQSARTAKARADLEEQNRLLYVAMTRARDRLYIAGFEGKNGRHDNCWYDIICDGLAELSDEFNDAEGRLIRRVSSSQAAPVEKAKTESSGAVANVPMPEWAHRAPARDAVVSLPLAPSKLTPYDVDEAGDPEPGKPAVSLDEVPDDPPTPTPLIAQPDYRFLRGTLTHALLEHLPLVPEYRRPEMAERYLTLRGADLPPSVQNSIISETLAILNDARFAPLFGPRSRAEVAIAADIPRPDGKGPTLRLTGKIDRLAEVGDDLMIVDYKSNRTAPDDVTDVAETYLLQLAAYRLALTSIYPGKKLRVALLWTFGPRILEIPDAQVAQAELRLWELSATSS
ncbi:Double-strand break repair helicase AddA [Candidatus Filomicrobium marinum]|uniref:DNA 3'-5' helicase n=1 Tax=Candidatus Filomicrobium marinum TaxID=1608628 RepID=A0A0D6JE56_9HYPH|nr:double-strand break repair helicase AddA [Candidatus Filomicrobium marinum]CFX19482.1 Double-strand break repair helicase AddA [Candidatus Filomicrobium marinum]CPR18521.1 Double-strand break repair helicase AddA [Candidatus Filomicrobium marinum]